MRYEIYLLVNKNGKPIYSGRTDTSRPALISLRHKNIIKLQEEHGPLTVDIVGTTDSLSEAVNLVRKYQYAHKITANVNKVSAKALPITYSSKSNTRLAMFGDGYPHNAYVQFKLVAGHQLMVRCNK